MIFLIIIVILYLRFDSFYILQTFILIVELSVHYRLLSEINYISLSYLILFMVVQVIINTTYHFVYDCTDEGCVQYIMQINNYSDVIYRKQYFVWDKTKTIVATLNQSIVQQLISEGNILSLFLKASPMGLSANTT